MITVKDFQKATEFPRACKDERGALRVGAAVGTSADTLERVAALREAGVDVIVVDTAHGHSQRRDRDGRAHQGEVAGAAGHRRQHRHRRGGARAGRRRRRRASRSASARARSAPRASSRASACRRSRAVANVAAALAAHGVPLIADGGIRFSGDVAKAIAAGAYCVMIGGLFAGTEESPGEVELYQGASYKSYRGMGSLGAMAQAPRLARPLLPGHRLRAREARAGRRRRPRAVQGQHRGHPAPARRAACAPRWATPAAAASTEMRTEPEVRAHHRRRHAREPRARRDDHQGSAELPCQLRHSHGRRGRADIHAHRDPDPRLRRAVHPADRAPRARDRRLLRDPPLGHRRATTSASSAPRGIILSGGPESVTDARAAAGAAGGVRARRAGARHLLRHADHGAAARRPGRRRPTIANSATPQVTVDAAMPPARRPARPRRRRGPRGARRVDEPRRPRRRAAAGLHRRGAARRTRRSPPWPTSRGGSTPCSSTPKSRTRCRASACSSASCARSAAARPLWSAGNIIDDAIARVRAQVGKDKVLLGLSGGVDSSVVAALLHRAIGDQLICVFVDHGLLRLKRGRPGHAASSPRTWACR